MAAVCCQATSDPSNDGKETVPASAFSVEARLVAAEVEMGGALDGLACDRAGDFGDVEDLALLLDAGAEVEGNR